MHALGPCGESAENGLGMPKGARNRSARPSYVVIGTSTGGVGALSRILKDLPPDFPGAILIVFHVPERGQMTWLAELLASVGRL